jgi:hypothetical protein
MNLPQLFVKEFFEMRDRIDGRRHDGGHGRVAPDQSSEPFEQPHNECARCGRHQLRFEIRHNHPHRRTGCGGVLDRCHFLIDDCGGQVEVGQAYAMRAGAPVISRTVRSASPSLPFAAGR